MISIPSVATSSQSIDILLIDSQIKESFEKERVHLVEYQSRLQEINTTLANPSLKTKLFTQLVKDKEDLEQKIQNIQSDNDYNFYLLESATLIEEYRKLLKIPLKLSFVGKPKEDHGKKKQLVDEYLKIAQKYLQIEMKVNETSETHICEHCTNTDNFIVQESSIICGKCFAQQERMHFVSSYKDVDRVNISTKYTYDRKVHFRDCINQYQGKQNCSIHKDVYNQLENAFERHHLLIGNKDTTPREERFSKITKEHVFMFLKELGFPKHYENVTLIHYNMTGKKPDDISYLEDKLLADFDLLVEAYDKMFKNKVSRVNFISTQYVLYQLLMKHKHPCKKEDFVILKTMDRKTFHDTICATLFSALNFSFIPLV
jgi:hypothetical protein